MSFLQFSSWLFEGVERGETSLCKEISSSLPSGLHTHVALLVYVLGGLRPGFCNVGALGVLCYGHDFLEYDEKVNGRNYWGGRSRIAGTHCRNPPDRSEYIL